MGSPALRRLVMSLLATVAFAAGARGAVAEDDEAARRNRYGALEHEILRATAEKRWEEVERLTREQIRLLPKDWNAHYNLACALALQGASKRSDALANLRRAVELGFDWPTHIEVDRDLDSLRGEPAFAEILAAARVAEAKRLANLYEPPQPVRGVKTVEGDPADGLRWRLRISPDASAKKPHRLVVWLHPSGGSMNARIEPIAADLAAKGWALLVMTSKRWESWTDLDAKRLLEKTLPDVARVEGVDPARPVLLGYSAGGQMALRLWEQDPARFGGVVLDAAYPSSDRRPDGTVAPRALAKVPGLDKTPVFVLVGDADEGHRLWKAAEDPWRKAGVPLRVTYVPGGEHQWLFGSEEGAALLAWLGDIAAGKCPGAETAALPPAMSDSAR
jgi:predicted esterase